MKSARQIAILEIIAENAVETQEELADALRKRGFQVTQATVSRDIKELRLVKVLSADVPEIIASDHRPHIAEISL